MSGFLLDTNVISELRKGVRASSRVRAWFEAQLGSDIYLSVLTLGEMRRGLERIRRRDEASATALEKWLERLKREYSDRLLAVTERIADRWGRLGINQPVPTVDALLAATALEHELVFVTGNETEVTATAVEWLNPFTGATSSGEAAGS